MIVDTPEETNGYQGLYGEVVTADSYKLKTIPFTPDVVIDLGGNIGVFARFAMSLWPDAIVVSVEPDEENQIHYKKFTPAVDASEEEHHRCLLKNVLIKAAIGQGDVWRKEGAVNGAHETYVSPSFAYPLKKDDVIPGINKVPVDTIMPDKIISDWVDKWNNPDIKVVVKIDIEGNEHVIFSHKPSMDALKKMDYICIEIHNWALTDDLIQLATQKTMEALDEFKATHDCVLDGALFYATKKQVSDEILFRKDLNVLLDRFKLPRRIAEVGVAEGRFSEVILNWGNIEKLYLVDNWATIPGQLGDGSTEQAWHDKNFNEAIERVELYEAEQDKYFMGLGAEKYNKRVEFHKGLSKEMAANIPNDSLGMVYIDASHNYEDVIADLQLFFPKVVDGGIIALHDYLNESYGVKKAVADFCLDMFEIHLIPDESESMASAWFRKI